MLSLSILLGVDISVRCGLSNCCSGGLVAWFPFLPVLTKEKARGQLYGPQIEFTEHNLQFNCSFPHVFPVSTVCLCFYTCKQNMRNESLVHLFIAYLKG